MASSLSRLPSHLSLNIKPSYKRVTVLAMQVRAQRFGDEGKSRNIVDANLSVLRERIEKVKVRERLDQRCCKWEYGWNYEAGYNYKLKNEMGLHDHFIDLVGLVCGSVGFTCIVGTLFLSLVSLFVHLSDQ